MARRKIYIVFIMMLFLTFFEVVSAEAANTDGIRFVNIDIKDGLSQNTIYHILQDHRGYMWFATQDGLNRFDGSGFKLYKNDRDNPETLSINTVSFLLEDSSGHLWVGTGNGLNEFNPETETFKRYLNKADDETTISNNSIYYMINDKNDKNIIWIGTGEGLNKLDIRTGKVKRYLKNEEPKSLGNNGIRTIADDGKGNLWIGTYGGGLYKFGKKSEEFEGFRVKKNLEEAVPEDFILCMEEDKNGHLVIGTDKAGVWLFDRTRHTFLPFFDNEKMNLIQNSSINCLQKDDSGRLWIGTNDKGVYIFDQKKNTLLQIDNDKSDAESLTSNWVKSLYNDNNGRIWVGTYTGGISLYDKDKFKFGLYKNNPFQKDSLINNIVRCFDVERDGTLWIGTEGGVDRVDRNTGKFYHYTYDANNPYTINSNTVRSMYRDSKDILWVSTWNGISWYDKKNDRFVRYTLPAEIQKNVRDIDLRFIYEDRREKIWIGSEKGLLYFDPKTGKYDYYNKEATASRRIVANQLRFVFEDSQDNLWFTAIGGTFKITPSTGEITNYDWGSEPHNPFNKYFILGFYEDSQYLWFGTLGGGLCRMNKKDGRFSSFSVKEGMPNEVVYGILEDAQDFFWMSTNRGIVKFDPLKETIKGYDLLDGLQSNEYNNSAYYKSYNGEMFFGGMNGYNSFFPEKMNDSSEKSNIVFTNIQIANKDVASVYKLEKSGGVFLRYFEKHIRFDFTALDYTNPQRIKYAYKLEGYDKDFINAQGNKMVSYTNLNPGKYRFLVKSTNSDGVWTDNTASIGVTVEAPPWKHPVAYIIYAFLSIVLFATISRTVSVVQKMRIKKIQLKNAELEEKVKERTTELEMSFNEINNQKLELEEVNRKLNEANEKLEYLSYHDPLTGVFNRLGLDRFIGKYAMPEYQPLGMFVLDVDGLKHVNDSLGHKYGDQLLQSAVVEIQKIITSDQDIVARIGGDEFVMLIPKCTLEKIKMVKATLECVICDYNDEEPDIYLSISGGYAISNILTSNIDELFAMADESMYTEKEARREEKREKIFRSITRLQKKIYEGDKD